MRQALVDELELKLGQDKRLLKEVYSRFREESCERQACRIDSTCMKKAFRERAALQQTMLAIRYKQHDILQRNNVDTSERLSRVSTLGQRCSSNTIGKIGQKGGQESCYEEQTSHPSRSTYVREDHKDEL